MQDLGLDDFLAKLKVVTRRTNGLSLPASSGGAADAIAERTYKSDLAELDAELDELKNGPDGSAVMKRRTPTRAQRSAAPPQAREDDVALISGDGGTIFTAGGINNVPQRGNMAAASPQAEDDVALISGDGTEVFSSGAPQSLPPAWSMNGQRLPADSAMGDNNQGPADIRNKISRMQKALAQSREMRASLVNMNMPALPPRHFEMPSKTAPRAVRGAPPGNGPPAVVARSPRPSFSPPVMQSQPWQESRGQQKWSAESRPSPPPQLLRRNDAKPAPDNMSDAPLTLSEQELLAQVSQYYGADPALQNELWTLIADGVVRTPNQLRAAAQDQVFRRENRTPQGLGAMPGVSSNSTGPQQPRPHHNQAGHPSPHLSGWRPPILPHQQNLSQSIDFHGHQQAPGPLSSSFDFGAPRPHQQNAQPRRHGPRRQGPPAAASFITSWGMPPTPAQEMMPGKSRSQDHDILSRSFGEISKLAGAPAYGRGVPQPAPKAPMPPPMQPPMQPMHNMQMPPRQPPPQMLQMMPAAPVHPQHNFGVIPRGPQANQSVDLPANATAVRVFLLILKRVSSSRECVTLSGMR